MSATEDIEGGGERSFELNDLYTWNLRVHTHIHSRTYKQAERESLTKSLERAPHIRYL